MGEEMVGVLTLLDLDPNIVKPGWTPLLITIALAAVMVLLFISLRRQFKRIDVSQGQPPAPAPTEASEAETVQGPAPKA